MSGHGAGPVETTFGAVPGRFSMVRSVPGRTRLIFARVQLRPWVVPDGPLILVFGSSTGSVGPPKASVAGVGAVAAAGADGTGAAGADVGGGAKSDISSSRSVTSSTTPPAAGVPQARTLWCWGAIAAGSSSVVPTAPAAESSRNGRAVGSAGSACPFAVKNALTMVRRSLQVSGFVKPLAARLRSSAQKPSSSVARTAPWSSTVGP